MMFARFSIFTLLLCGILSMSASAQDEFETIVAYGLFGQSGDQEFSDATEFIDGITPVEMTRGGGLLPTNANHAFNSNGWATNVPETETVVNEDAYVEFGFDTDADVAVMLEQLIIGTRSSGSGPSEIGIFTSVDGFAEPFHTLDQRPGGFLNSTIDLSELGAVTGEFRLRFKNVGGNVSADPDRLGDMDEQSTWRIANHFDDGFSDSRILGSLTDPGMVGGATCMPANGLLGDLDGNGEVAFLDFLTLANNFGNETNNYADGDVNCDGSIGFLDFLALAENFGDTLEAGAAVPEPTGLFLSSLGLIGMLCVRRRRA